MPAAPGVALRDGSPFFSRPVGFDVPAFLDAEVREVVRKAAPLLVSTVGGLLLLTPLLLQSAPPVPEALRWPGLTGPAAERTVFLCGDLADEDLIAFTTAVWASGHPGVVLFDVPKSSRYTSAFLADFRPACVIPVGSFAQSLAELEERLAIKMQPVQTWPRGPPAGLLKHLFPKARRVVVSPAEPRRLLLQAACLAGAAHAPLFISHGAPDDVANLKRCLTDWQTEEILATGTTYRLCRNLPGTRVTRLLDEKAVVAAALKQQHKKGPIRTLVVANPADCRPGLGGTSALAPWLALQRRAALLLTHDGGEDVEAVVRTALKTQELHHADTLLLAGSLKALPMDKRPNPLSGSRDPYIELEPLTPQGAEPVSFATGRLFHQDRGLVGLTLARQRLWRKASTTPPRALVVSNPGGSLPLLEVFSQNTAREFRNVGYQTTSLFGDRVSRDEVRRLLPEQTVFLWEGHHNTLIRDFGIQRWTEPLRPSLIFLQSCLALTESKVQPFLERGAVAAIGSPTRTYSASGGAFALAFFDACLYENQSVGAALRQAKNYLLAFALLKEKRLGAQSQLGGANVRAAWAFALWGDPTLKLPRPPAPPDALPAVRHHVQGNTIVVTLPEATHTRVVSEQYQVAMRPNARLAGLLNKGDGDSHALVPLVFQEVALPAASPGKAPRLRSRLPGRNWVFCWDARRLTGYLLAAPRSTDHGELRFHIDWE
jgi:hypothetical protein